MAPDHALLAHATELLAPLGTVRARRMFGGHGLYLDGLFMALLADNCLYLKADAQVQASFAAAGSQPFAFTGARGRQVVMGYWRAPDEAMESATAMAPWARLALASALRAAAAKTAAKPRKTATQAAAGQAARGRRRPAKFSRRRPAKPRA